MEHTLTLLTALLLVPLAFLKAAEPISASVPGTRILFQGDSITDSNRGRSADPNHILGHERWHRWSKPVASADIARVRQEVTDRKTPWTHEELLTLTKQKLRN